MEGKCRFPYVFSVFITLFLSVTVRNTFASNHGPDSDASSIRVAILSCMDPVETYKKFHPLVHYLESRTGRRVTLQVPRDYNTFLRMVRQGQTDFSYQSAHIFLTLEQYLSPEMRLSTLTVSGKRQYHALLVARSDSSIETIGDLRGKSVLFGPRQSTLKTFAAKQLLEEHGIDVEADLHDNSYGSSCVKTAFNVYLKAYDAGFVCAHSYHALMREENPDWPIPPGSLKIIAETMAIPTWIFSASKGIDPAMISLVREALLELSHDSTKEHGEILHSIESSGFVVTRDGDLATLRNRFVLQ